MICVVVLILNWENAVDTIECFRSVRNLDLDGINLKIVIIDNCSKDNSWMSLREGIVNEGYKERISSYKCNQTNHQNDNYEYSINNEEQSEVYLIRSPVNGGYASGNNIGIRLGLHLSANYFWILNNDTLVDKYSLIHFERKMRNDPTIGICGASVKNYFAPHELQCMGGYRYSAVTGRGWPVSYSGSPTTISIRNIENQISYINGACMFVSREFINEIGFLNEDYFLYCEEIDWAYRCNGLYRLGFEPNAIVYHKEGATAGTSSLGDMGSPASEFYQARSKLKFTWLHNKPYLISVSIFLLLRAAKAFLKGNFATAFAISSAFYPSKRKFF